MTVVVSKEFVDDLIQPDSKPEKIVRKAQTEVIYGKAAV